MPNQIQVPANVNGPNFNKEASDASSPIRQAFAPKGPQSVLNQTAQAVEQMHNNPPAQGSDYQGPDIKQMDPERLKMIMAADANQRQRAAMSPQDSEQQHPTYPATE